MFKVIYSEDVILSITDFVKKFHSKNISLYVDSGLDDELYILESYKSISTKMRNNIDTALNIHFSSEVIGSMKGENGTYSVVSYGNFRMFVNFYEVQNKKIRYLDSIDFFMK